MTDISALIYGPGDQRRFIMGTPENVTNSVILYLTEAGVEARLLAATPLADLMSVLDPRIPETPVEFDDLYPGAAFVPEPPAE
jgi:hypothetical protein